MRASFTCVAALLLTAVGLGANAQTSLWIDYDWTSNYNINVYNRASLTGPGSGFAGQATAAIPFHADFVGSANPGGAPSPFNVNTVFDVYCIDINHGQYNDVYDTVTAPQAISGGTTTDPPVSANELTEAAWLIDTYGGLNADANSALQVAIWSVVSGNTITTTGNDVTDGTNQYFYVGGYASALSSDADFMLNALGAITHNGTNLTSITGPQIGYVFNIAEPNPPPRGVDTGQNVLSGYTPHGPITGGNNPLVTPEGSTMAMLAFGLAPLGFGWFRRRRAIS
jgi:hypothetical protein